ncbi:nucleoside monophosphate kinase [Candidatus Woesearchaeota archaeon]|nr:nucleoside monophosphate kinase [Candidatus Woesearchaeota archaeon]
MIITIAGTPGSGKSTVAKLLAKQLKLKHYSAGDFMREIAKERKISLETLQKQAEHDHGDIDREIDLRTKKLGVAKDNFVIDGRLAWHFIPKSKKIFLDVELATGARRIFLQERSDEHSKEYLEAVNKVKKRIASEQERYKKYYGIEPYNPKHFDFVIDTTERTPEEVVDEIIQWLDHGK